jgi:pimeloyl-ACP methyl ester carboxylesterase
MADLTLKNGPLRFSALTAGFDLNPEGEIVVCLHGFPDDAHSFDAQLPALAEAGYRVVAPYLRGYEPSSQPDDGDYSISAIARDVIAWVEGFEVEAVHLIGHDWGAAATYTAGALAPERFSSLITIAVPHAARFDEAIRKVPRQLARSWYMAFFNIPGISEYAVQRNDWSLVKTLWKRWSPSYAMPDHQWHQLRSTFEADGVKGAMLAYYRQNASPALVLGIKKNEVAELTSVPVRTLAITGVEDGCIDTRMFDHCFDDGDFPAGVAVERVQGAGHFAHQERPDEVNQLILTGLSANSRN